MRFSNVALAALISLMVTLPVLPVEEGSASAIPVPGGGRAEGDPPLNGTQWDIVQDYTITGSTISFAGNITVLNGANLRIKNMGRLLVPHNVANHWVLMVKAGGNVEITNASELDIDHYIAESGTGLTILNQSIVRANGVFNATSTVTCTDSTVTVTAPSGLDPSQPGEAAKLHLDSGTAGNIQRSTVSVTAGNGQNGVDGNGTEGGAGGSVSVIVTSKEFTGMKLTAIAGNGGKGGTPGSSTANAGKGGRGGSIAMKVVGNTFSDSTITATSGNGGDGLGGLIGTGPLNGGNGGEGGEAGTVNFIWTGKGIIVSQGSNISISSGHGGKGGGGGLAQGASGKDGGSGGRGGNGGNIVASIACEGPMSVTDSSIGFMTGYGPSGGVFGRATTGGKDGSAGEGGEGGSCAFSLALNDTFTGSNCTLLAGSGDGGAGGLGSTGGKGGAGGSSLLNLSLETLLTENTVSLRNSVLASRGGAGGAGGKGLSVDNSQGQPGDGGKGGGARLFISADKSVELWSSKLLCDEGVFGPADPPAKAGNPGVGELYIYTRTVNMHNSIYSQTMGWVDNNDFWTLESSPLVRTNPPIKPPHFMPRAESGVAEEYWLLTVVVKDIYNTIVTDGTVMVEVFKGDALVTSKKADHTGYATFRLIGARYKTNPADEFFGQVYIVRATQDSGLFSYPVSVQMTEDRTVSLIIIDKPFAPKCNITAPSIPILDVSQFVHTDGRTDMYIIEGNAQDHNENPMPVISKVEVKIGDDSPWIPANFEMATPNFFKWNLTWDIYNWSVAKLALYPSGMIPCPIYAHSYNDRFWSDDLAHHGTITIANITVKFFKIPPAPPEIQITRPAVSPFGGNWSFKEVPFEKMVAFDGTVLRSFGTRIIRWEWCFDDTHGYEPDFSSPISPSTNASFPKDKANLHFYVVLKAFDNESARRVELLRAGVSYDEFGYYFETSDGSIWVKLRVLVKPTPPMREPPKIPWLYISLSLVSLVMMLGAVQTFRVRRRTLAERKAKEERESLRIDVSEMKCARCNEPIADPSAGCLQCKAQDALGQIQKRLLDIKGSGVNVTEAESLLEIGVDAFDSKSYTEAYDKAQEAKAKATELEEKYQKTSKIISGWETRIAAMKVDRPEADMSEAETRVYHSRLALGRGDHEEAIKNLDGLEGVLAKADKVGVRKGAQDLLESTRRMLANIQKRGVILDKRIETNLAEAAGALEQGNYDLVTTRCKESETLVKETNKAFMRASEHLRQGESRVLNAKGMGQNVGQTEDWLAQAKTAMGGGNYATVIDLTGKVLGFFGVAVKPAVAEKRVDWKREAAVLEGRDGKAAPAMTAAPAPAAPVTAMEVESSPELKESTEKLIKDAHEAVARAREAAADVTDGEELLEKAKDAYKARRYDEASDLAKSARYLLAELAAAAPKPKPVGAPAPAPRPAAAPTIVARPAAISGAAAELKATIEKAEKLLADLAEAGGDISGPEDKLKRSKAARDGGSPAVAMQYANEAISETEGLMKEYLEAKNSMETVQKDLTAARDRGLDVSDAEFQLKQARAAMAGGAFVRAADTAKMVDQMLKEMEPAAAPSKPQAPAAEAAAKAPSVKCPGCGRDAKPHWKTCPFCGAAMAGVKPAAEAPRPAVTPAPAGAPAPIPPETAPRPAAPRAPVIVPAAESPKPPVIVPAAESPKPPVVVPAPAPATARLPAQTGEAPPRAGSCPRCNAALKPHWKVCPSCGTDVKGAPEAGPPAPPKADKCPACGSKVEPSWTSCPICNTALLPDKGVKPEAPKKVLKVAKRPVITGAPKADAPGEPGDKTPVLKIAKKPTIVTRDEENK